MRLVMDLKTIAEHLDASLHNVTEEQAKQLDISKVAPVDKAQEGDIAFLNDKKYLSALAGTQASAVILNEKLAADFSGVALIVKDPYVGFALTAQLLDPTPKPHYQIHPSAFVDSS